MKKTLLLVMVLVIFISMSNISEAATSFHARIYQEGQSSPFFSHHLGSSNCAYLNPFTREYTWGSRSDCQNRCPGGQGYYYANVTTATIENCPVSFYSPGLPVPRNPPWLRVGGPTGRITFSIEGITRQSQFCDCTNPTTAFTSPASLAAWYREGTHDIPVSWSDNYRNYRMLYDRSILSGGSWVVRLTSFTPVPTTAAVPPGSGVSGTGHIPLTIGLGLEDCSVSGAGACRLRIRARDYWDRVSAIVEAFMNVDMIPPASSFAWSRIPDYDIGGNWYRNGDRPGYSITCTDTLSGCRQINSRTCLGGTTTCTAYTTRPVSGSPATQTYLGTTLANCPDQRCLRNVRFFSYDNATALPGNSHTEQSSGDILLDGVPPLTTLTAPSDPNPVVQWVATSFQTLFTCSDTTGTQSGSGCRNIYTRVAQGTSTICASGTYSEHPSSGATRTISCGALQTCTITACGYSIDNVGNTESPAKHQTYGIDLTPPTIDPPVLSPRSGDPIGSGGFAHSRTYDWYRDSVTVTFRTEDLGSGVNHCSYRIRRAGGTWSGWIDLTDSGGNVCRGSPLFGSEVRTRTVTYTQSLGTSSPCSSQGPNACEMQIRVIDAVGNIQYRAFSINTDYTAVQSQTLTWDTANHTDSSGNRWYNTVAGYTLTAQDSHSGIRLHERSHMQPASTVLLTRTDSYTGLTGQSTVTIRDIVGNEGDACTEQRCDRFVRYNWTDWALSYPGNTLNTYQASNTIRLDSLPPTTTIIPPSSPNPLSRWMGGTFTISYSCSDTTGIFTGSGCKYIYTHVEEGTSSVCTDQAKYMQQNPPSPTRTVSCPPDTTCTMTACGYSVDYVGHSEWPNYKFQTYSIDQEPPYISDPILSPRSHDSFSIGGFEQARMQDWYRDMIRVTFTAYDDHSGINECYYRLGTTSGSLGTWIAITDSGGNACRGSPNFGSEVRSRTVSYNAALGFTTRCSAEGVDACIMQIRVVDAVGNEMLSPEFSFNTDYTAPENLDFTWSPPNYTDSEGHWYNTRAPYTVYAEDPLSGIRRSQRQHMQPANTELQQRLTPYNFNSGVPSALISDIVGNLADSCSLQRCDRFVRYSWGDWGIRYQGNRVIGLESSVVLLDSVKPTTTITTPIVVGLQPSYQWVGENFDFTIYCTDTTGGIDGSGCKHVQYSCTIPGSCPSIGTITIPGNDGSFIHPAICTEGNACLFTLTRSATDNVNHTEIPINQLYGIDKVDPRVDGAGYQYSPQLRQVGHDNWMNESFNITVTVHDDHSGIGGCSYRVRNGGAWTTPSVLDASHGCPPGNANLTGPGVDEDRTRTLRIPQITVGDDQQCSVEGRDTCEIEITLTDMVGRTHVYSESVSIDYTPPTCDIQMLIDYVNPYDSSPYSHYNHTERTFYYNPNIAGYDTDPYVQMEYPLMSPPGYYNVTITGDDTNGPLSGAQVSGIRALTFPDITSGGGVHTVDNSLLSPSLESTIWSSMHHYHYNDGATQQGVFNVTVEDQAGNSAECPINVVVDTVPPLDVGSLEYDHYVDAADQQTYDPGFNTLIGQDDLSGVRDAFIYVYYADGIELTGSQHTPGCLQFEDRTAIPDLGERFVARISASDAASPAWNPIINETFSGRMISGQCHRFFLRVYDQTNNYRDYVDPNANIVAIDGVPDNFCRVFGRYDNCNNRSSEWLNNVPTTRISGIPHCPGSCVGGTVRLDGSPPTLYEDAEVFIEGFSDRYINLTNETGEYTIYNIIENDRPHAFTANPTGIHRALYLPRTQTILLERARYGPLSLPDVYHPRDFTFAFDPRVCNDDCVADADPFQLCRTDCLYTDEHGRSLCGAREIGVQEQLRLGLCAGAGAQKGWLIDYGSSQQIICCGRDGPIAKELINGTLEVDASHVARSERVVSFRGKLVRLIVTVFR
jgi:hypothetical protein